MNARASPVVFCQSGGNSCCRPVGRVWLSVRFGRMKEAYTRAVVPVANVGIPDEGHWQVEFPTICAGPHVVPFVVERAQATFEAVHEVRFVPPVELHAGPRVVATE